MANVWRNPIFDRTLEDVEFAIQKIAEWKKSHTHSTDIKVENDCDWDGSVMDSKSVILELYDEEFDCFESTYVDLNYFDKSDEELFEEFRADSIKMKEFMVKYHKHEYNSNTIIELNKQIEKLKNTKL